MKRMRIVILTMGLALGLSACLGAEPFEYEQTAGEMKPGGGVFTGTDGEWVIFESGGKREKTKDE